MTILCAAVMLLLLVFSRPASQAALEAARCFSAGVMPCLAPMMALGKLLPAANGPAFLPSALYGFAAGSPASAQRAAGIAGMERRTWESLLCLSGVMSPMFFTGTLAGWLGSCADGWKLLMVHWAGAALTAAAWYLLCSPQDTSAPRTEASPPRASLPQAISQTAQSLLCILGAMVVFAALAGLLKSMLSAVFPRWTARHGAWTAVLHAFLESGGGASAICLSMQKPHAALSAACGFGGVSILLQNMLFLEGRIRPARLAAMRALHAAFSFALARFIWP